VIPVFDPRAFDARAFYAPHDRGAPGTCEVSVTLSATVTIAITLTATIALSAVTPSIEVSAS